ncbi:MAG: hypothetical protein AAF243_14130, partial [Cyanobacteria bacterium P01_A01_bin.137]
QMIASFDTQPADAASTARVVRAYPVTGGDASTIGDLLESVFGDTTRQWWEDASPDEVQVRVNRRTGVLLVVATEDEHTDIKDFLDGLAADGAIASAATTQVLPVEYVPADELARTLDRFLDERARGNGGGGSRAVISSFPLIRGS